MSTESDLPPEERRRLRRAIREYITNNDAPTYSEIVTAVAEETEADPTDVGRELDDLERVGFVYPVSTDDGPRNHPTTTLGKEPRHRLTDRPRTGDNQPNGIL